MCCLGGLQGRGDDHQPTIGGVEDIACGGQRRGLPRPGRTFDHQQPRIPSQGRDHPLLCGVEVPGPAAHPPRRVGDRASSASTDTVHQVSLNTKDTFRGQVSDMLRDIVAVQQRNTPCTGTLGDVLDQLTPHKWFSDDVDGGDQSLHTATDIGRVPRRPPRPEPAQHQIRCHVTVQPPDLHPRHDHQVWHGGGGWSEAEVTQHAVPGGDEVRATAGDDLVGSGVRPRPPVPGTAQLGSGLGVGVLSTPRCFVPVDVAVDLRRALAEPTRKRRKLLDLTLAIKRVTTCSEGGPELGVAQHRGVTDPVERLDAVHHTDRVQSPPCPLGEDACVDLYVEVTVRVTGARGVVPHHGGLELLHRDLHLPAPWTDPGGGVLGDPPDHLTSSPVHRRVVRHRNLGVECHGHRPRLRAVHHNLDEPQRPRIIAQSSLRRTRDDVVAGDPSLVGVPVQRPPLLNCTHTASPLHQRSRGDMKLGHPGALSQVVIIGTRVVRLDIGACRRRGPAVELHPTVHASSPTVSTRQLPLK